MELEKFMKRPLLGIVRGIHKDKINRLAETVISAGLNHIEITMNTDGAAPMIKELIRAGEGLLSVGAGTVLSLEDMHAALDAGAGFIVSPVIVEEVMAYCVKNSIPVFPGAMTPQDIYRAWQLGATMVKLFPAKSLGPVYIREIKGPLDKVPLLACGGVSPANIGEFFDAGCEAIAFGGSIFKREWMERGDWDSVGRALQELIGAYGSLSQRH